MISVILKAICAILYLTLAVLYAISAKYLLCILWGVCGILWVGMTILEYKNCKWRK